MLNGNPWFSHYRLTGGWWLDFAVTGPAVQIGAGQQADLSYGASVDAACWYDSPEYPPSFDSWCSLEFQNGTGYPSFIGINCPEPLPPVEYGSPYTATATVFSQLVAQIPTFAYTRAHYAPPGTYLNCSTNDLGQTVCNFVTELWCTPDTSPPYTMFDPNPVRDGLVGGPPGSPSAIPANYYWETYSLCTHNSITSKWDCLRPGFSWGLGYTDQPRASCTKIPLT